MEKINKLKKFINDYNLDGYIIPKNEFLLIHSNTMID